MFSFFKKILKPSAPVASPISTPSGSLPSGSLIGSALVMPIDIPVPGAVPAERQRWLSKLSDGLRKTGTSISSVFTGTQINEALYEDLESALLMADAGVGATQYLLDDVKRRV